VNLKRLGLAVAIASVLVALTACTAPNSTPATSSSSPKNATASESAMATTLAYVKSGLPDLAGKKIAYLAECASENPYCQARLAGAQEAAGKLGAAMTVFDAGFDPAAQLKQVQDAIQRGFDGFVFSPVADATGCSDFKLLQATKKPVATINSPMCGNPDYTKGTAGFVGMQTETFFQQHVEAAFKTCTGKCDAVAVGGYVGSDLFTRWENAIKAAAAKYPNVTVVSDQPGSFDAKSAFTVVQDALTSHPNVSIVLSSWDDMTRGVEQAITAAGKKPGTDVKIFSVGGTKYASAKVVSGTWNETSILLPREESYYGFVQLAQAMKTGTDTPGFTYLAQAPVIVQGPGSIFITSQNAAKFTPEY
jgi:ABC-type sugar transport system substrate-binding protein